MPVDVGLKLSARLQAMGITEALGLADANPATIRKRFSVVLERTVRELNGISCLGWESVPALCPRLPAEGPD